MIVKLAKELLRVHILYTKTLNACLSPISITTKHPCDILRDMCPATWAIYRIVSDGVAKVQNW